MIAGALEPGVVLGGDFVVVRPLGSGGMGAVYVAEQRSTGKLRALKVMHQSIAPDETLQRRFEQEARVSGRIDSAHVVDVVAAGVDAATGLPYLVMELLEGTDLRHHLDSHGVLDSAEVRWIFEQLCHGIAAAHAAGIVHRDLKPENVFLARESRAGSESRTVKVLDFGIAKLIAEAATHATAAVGSPLWMAPEQTTPGPVTPAADVWALGLIAYELLTGEHFWRAASQPTATPMHLLREIVLEPIPPASERGGARLPAGFDAWFARCVARDPRERFQDAGALWRALVHVIPATGAEPSAQAFAETAMAPHVPSSIGSPPLAGQTPHAVVAPVVPITLKPPPASPRSFRTTRVAMAAGLGGLLIASGVGLMAVRQSPEVTAGSGALASGFGDPHDEAREERADGPVLTDVQGRHVRLLVRIEANKSNVADAVVRKALEWSSWEYLRCYERIFKPAKDLPRGVIEVGFDILDQLPQHATLVSSTFASPEMGECVRRTVSGKTINAARATGAGHVVYGFQFVVVD